jgi:membrane protein implicated in regulation of membrane protease activity
VQSVYLFSLVVGWILVGLSLLGGLLDSDADLEAEADADLDFDADTDADAEFGGDFDADFDADLDSAGGLDLSSLDPAAFDLEGAGLDVSDLEHEGMTGTHAGDLEVHGQRRFNPFVSFKFYTFFLAFFGLTGMLFTWLDLWSTPAGVAAVSVGMGVAAGLGMTYTMHLANSGNTRGIVGSDYLGASGKVVLPIDVDQAGKIRVTIRGRTFDMRAELADDEETTLDIDDACFVLGVEDGIAQVVDVSTVEQQLVRRADDLPSTNVN